MLEGFGSPAPRRCATAAISWEKMSEQFTDTTVKSLTDCWPSLLIYSFDLRQPPSRALLDRRPIGGRELARDERRVQRKSFGTGGTEGKKVGAPRGEQQEALPATRCGDE